MRRWLEERRAAHERVGPSAGPSGPEPPAEPAPAHPSATVVLLRDVAGGLEVLLARRSSKLAFHGGSWVFPGGRIDPDDFAGGEAEDVFAAARRAAAREAFEEAGVHVDSKSLVHLSNWTTPEIAPKRFATWFFAGTVGGGEERADGSETEALAWFDPDAALAARAAGEIELAPPQFVTLLQLRVHRSTAAALESIAVSEAVDFAPRFCFGENGLAVCVYAGDVAYDELGRLDEPGPRHRLLMTDEAWTYERHGGA